MKAKKAALHPKAHHSQVGTWVGGGGGESGGNGGGVMLTIGVIVASLRENDRVTYPLDK